MNKILLMTTAGLSIFTIEIGYCNSNHDKKAHDKSVVVSGATSSNGGVVSAKNSATPETVHSESGADNSDQD